MMMVCPRCWNHKNPYCDKCENTGKIPDVRLTRNFLLSEMVHSNTAKARRIPNDPNTKQMDRILEATKNLYQRVRDDNGPLVVTSGFRSPALNSVIQGSSKSSAHMAAYAIDVQPRKGTVEDLMYWFHYTKIPFDQVILELVGGKKWVHIGYKHPSSGAQRRQLLVNRDGQWSQWLP